MINITLPDGSVRQFEAPVTVGEVAASIGAGLAKAALGGKVDGKLVDASFRIENDASLEIVTDKHPDALDVLRHSTAHLLAQAVDRTLTVTTNVITVGLAIAAALANQKRTMEATKATQEYAGNILASNAAAIRQQTADIAQMYNNPVLALEKVQKSYDDLMAAMDEVEKVKRQGIETAKEGMARLSDMSGKLAQKAGLTAGETLAAPQTPSVSSIEA